MFSSTPNQIRTSISTKLLNLGLLFVLLGTTMGAIAQPCSQPPVCIPGTATSPLAGIFGTGINRVVLAGSLSARGGGATTGYRNFKCDSVLTISAGSPISVSVTTSANVNENVRIWADWNNDNDFDLVNELVFSSDNARVHTGQILPPGTAINNNVLRLRIASDNIAAQLPTPCFTPEFGQAIDVGLVLVPNVNKPVANFTSADTITCTGLVNFQDLSINAPSSWAWSFGDGNFATNNNPQHQYARGGVYTVQLIATNSNGSDTITKLQYITFRDSVPVAPVCTPQTTSPCCNYGIGSFKLGSINTTNESATVQQGYIDYACKYQTELLPGVTYNFSFKVGTARPQTSKLYLDQNADGDFDDADELIWSSTSATGQVQGSYIAPNNPPLNQYLRLRLISDYEASPFTSCGPVANGTTMDFGVVFRPNPNPPVARFVVNQPSLCAALASFTSTSINQIDTLYWDFGDGTKATTLGNQKTVQHTYTALGQYDVKLVVVGSRGRDTILQPDAVVYITSLQPTCTQQRASRPCCNLGIYRVKIADMDVSSGSALAEGYVDRTCSAVARVMAGDDYNISITVGPSNTEVVKGYLDINNDGQFTSGELMFTLRGINELTGLFRVPANIVTGAPLRLRILSDVAANAANILPCNRLANGQVEDFSLLASPNTLKPLTKFNLPYTLTCRRSFNFIDSSVHSPTSWKWYFGDGDSSSLQNPAHTYAASGTYTVTLITANSFGADTLVRTNWLQIVETPIKPAACITTTNNTCCNYAPKSIQIGSIFNFARSTYQQVPYTDLGCEALFYADKGKSYPITVQSFGLQEDLAIYVDYNNNGQFEASELSFSSVGQATHTGNITFSPAAVVDTVLRVRVIVDAPFRTSVLEGCGQLQNGQSYDFGVILRRGTTPPVVGFNANALTTCSGIVAFTDTSSTVGDSWLWTFGDGNTSTLPNPVHQYQAAGTYDVSLKVTNTLGRDSLVKTGYITVSGIYGPKPADCTPYSNQPNQVSRITQFQFGNINRTTTGNQYYRDNTCQDTTTIYLVTPATNPQLQVNTVNQTRGLLQILIDLNNNGVFEFNETIISSNVTTSFMNNIPYAILNQAVKNTFIRLRVVLYPNGTQLGLGCIDLNGGNAQDYGIKVTTLVGLFTQQTLQFEVFPNPASGIIMVHLPDFTSESMVKVTNALGQEVHAETLMSQTTQLDLAHLPKGVYNLQIAQGGKWGVKRLVLQ